MALKEDLQTFLLEEAKSRFLEYVTIHTTSDDNSQATPTTERQFKLAGLVKDQLVSLGLKDAEVDGHCYVYGTLPASPGCVGPSIGLLAHLDTSPAVSGENVKPFIRIYEGGDLTFPDDPALRVTPADSPELSEFIGREIITASGTTLLGADDKAGIAEILAALAAFQRFPELKHPEIRVCLTPDEETGGGTAKIRTEKLGRYCYTLDGGMIGELETECFDARGAKVRFTGLNVHPGYAKGKMINAGAIAARFFAALPEWQTPERTSGREGFYHLLRIEGDESSATLTFIIRDFVAANNDARIRLLESLKSHFENTYPGLSIQLEIKDQYRNMVEVLNEHPAVADTAREAIEMIGIPVRSTAIRGGTDGARLSFMGYPTPNLFAGGLLFHSKKEWIPVVALQKAAEVVVNLCGLWHGRSA